MKTKEQVYNFLLGHIKRFPHTESAWYAGVAEDPKDRLFYGHGVDIQFGLWAYAFCSTSDEARYVEKALIELGCKGGGGGGNNSTKGCYVYLVTHSTREE